MAKCQLCGGKLPLFPKWSEAHVCRFPRSEAPDSDFGSVDTRTSPFSPTRQFTLSPRNEQIPVLDVPTAQTGTS